MNDYDEVDFLSQDLSFVEPLSPEQFRQYRRHVLGPAWRWTRAKQALRRECLPSGVSPGNEIWQIIDYLGGLPDSLREAYPTIGGLRIAEAEAINNDPTMRLHVQARILAGMPSNVVAARTNLHPQLIQDYCEIFFDVEDSREAKDWLATHVFGPQCTSNSVLHCTVCHDAFFGGEALCEYWIERLPHLLQECDLSTSRGREVKRLQLILRHAELCRGDAENLGEILIKGGRSFTRQSKKVVNGSQVIGQWVAQQLSKLLNESENAPAVVQFMSDKPGKTCSSQRRA